MCVYIDKHIYIHIFINIYVYRPSAEVLSMITPSCMSDGSMNMNVRICLYYILKKHINCEKSVEFYTHIQKLARWKLYR
jgi:hypothetical protein